MAPYRHVVQYYETDMMGLVHHSNYIRWMEEARIDFMARLGYPYDAMEHKGIVSPVRSVQCAYKKGSTFGDEIDIGVYVDQINAVMLTIAYEMKNTSGEIVCTGKSEHVFLNRDGKLLRMDRELPEFMEALRMTQGSVGEAHTSP